MFDIKKILKRSWHILWNYRMLWVFGFILALTVGLAALVLKILVMDIERSRNAVKTQRLVQRIGLLESELRDVQETMPKPDQGRGYESTDASDLGSEF